MKNIFKKIITFIIIFGIIIAINMNNSDDLEAASITTENEDILAAIENLKFYSSFNYQTLYGEKLNQLSVDFYVPIKYDEVEILWSLDSKYLSLSNNIQQIEINSINGLISIDVLKVTILSTPNVFEGNQTFSLIGTFSIDSESYDYTYTGSLVPIIPNDFFGGTVYTLVRYASMFLQGVLVTLGLSLSGTIIGFIMALIIVSGKTIEINESDKKAIITFKKIVISLSSLYVTIFRGTPMIVQASFFWYGLGLFGDPLICGLFVVSLNTAAYITEIIRGGINSLDKGQTEAAKSLGMTRLQMMILVIFPQAIKNSMPAIGNEFVINIKDTAVLSVIGIFELFNQTQRIAGMHYRQLEAYFVVALIYLFLTYSVTTLLKKIERKMDLEVQELPSSN
jgi:putative lysine transport system permease protein